MSGFIFGGAAGEYEFEKRRVRMNSWLRIAPPIPAT